MAIVDRLKAIYPKDQAEVCYLKLQEMVESYREEIDSQQYAISQKDVVLITYGDQVYQEGKTALEALNGFMDEQVGDCINSVHLLPFYPYSSDDGFSVEDYKAVNPDCGNWKDVKRLSKRRRLMFDAVVNHCSQHNAWFKGYLANDPQYADFFIDMDPATDLSQVTRPRALPLLTTFKDSDGKNRHIWTTFSDDQVDLNPENPEVLLAIIDVLLFYLSKGARLIRLDAIAFLWKEIGTTCLHLEQTHEIIKLIREVFDDIAPETIIITETNVPHAENISYFGNGKDEAHMVYNFSLPPLLAHAMLIQNTSVLSDWADSLELPSQQVTFFNFTASHDGIGMRPATGILPPEEIDRLVKNATDNGGNVSYKDNGDGTQSPYELNCNYMDFLSGPDVDDAKRAERMLVAQSVMLAMPGVPGIYFHSLVGSRNWNAGVDETKRFRTINREKLERGRLEAEIADSHHLRHRVFNGYKALLDVRTQEPAFHPHGDCQVERLNDTVFALKRTSPDGEHVVLALQNLGEAVASITLPGYLAKGATDLLTDMDVSASDIKLGAHQVMWLKAQA